MIHDATIQEKAWFPCKRWLVLTPSICFVSWNFCYLKFCINALRITHPQFLPSKFDFLKLAWPQQVHSFCLTLQWQAFLLSSLGPFLPSLEFPQSVVTPSVDTRPTPGTPRPFLLWALWSLWLSGEGFSVQILKKEPTVWNILKEPTVWSMLI